MENSYAGSTAFVCVPISIEIYNELVIRRGKPDTDVGAWIESVVEDYLDRTADDGDWSPAYYEWRSGTQDLEAFTQQYGDSTKGYHWGRLFLPNATKIAMTYKERQYHAEVRHQEIHYENATYSPSELARRIANNTSRNAWRDLMIRRPSDTEWILADTLRERATR